MQGLEASASSDRVRPGQTLNKENPFQLVLLLPVFPKDFFCPEHQVIDIVENSKQTNKNRGAPKTWPQIYF